VRYRHDLQSCLGRFWICHYSRTLFCRAVPNPNLTVRNFFIAVWPAPPVAQSVSTYTWSCLTGSCWHPAGGVPGWALSSLGTFPRPGKWSCSLPAAGGVPGWAHSSLGTFPRPGRRSCYLPAAGGVPGWALSLATEGPVRPRVVLRASAAFQFPVSTRVCHGPSRSHRPRRRCFDLVGARSMKEAHAEFLTSHRRLVRSRLGSANSKVEGSLYGPELKPLRPGIAPNAGFRGRN
jgi:hypothetical protein